MHCLNKDVGNYGENLAQKYLENLGYITLAKNFSCKLGEIDIIGKDNDYICFIEVKTRYSSMFGCPCESVNRKKQLKIYKTAQMYILKNKLFDHNFRFDVIEVLLNTTDDKHSIRLIRNAFQV